MFDLAQETSALIDVYEGDVDGMVAILQGVVDGYNESPNMARSWQIYTGFRSAYLWYSSSITLCPPEFEVEADKLIAVFQSAKKAFEQALANQELHLGVERTTILKKNIGTLENNIECLRVLGNADDEIEARVKKVHELAKKKYRPEVKALLVRAA